MLTAAAVTPTGIITAASAFVIAVTGLVSAFAVLIPLLRSQQRSERATVATHELINGEHDRTLARQAAQDEALASHGITVPGPEADTPINDLLVGDAPSS